jgi:phosphate-selective porin OprO and OprP
VRHFTRFVLMGMLVGLSMSAPNAVGQEKDKPVLEQLLDLLLQRGQINQEQYNTLQEQARKEQSTGIQVGLDHGRPFLRAADGKVRFDLGGRFQLDFDRAEDGARTLMGAHLGSQFLVRRARLEVNGQFFQWIDLKIESDFTDSQPLRDVYLDFRFFPELRLRGGQFKAPFSLEELTSDLYIDFVERSLINELAPSFDRGVMAYGNIKQGVVSYSLGGFNGTGQNASDNNGDKDVAARLVIAPWKTSDNFWLKGVQLAGNVTWGNESGLATAQGRTEARTPNRFVYFAAQPAQGERLRYGGDLAWLVGPAGVKFEYDVQTHQRRGLGPLGSDLDKVTATGWYVSGTYLLTGEEKRLSAPVVPTYPFAPITGQWGPGAWELGLRYADLAFRSDDPVNFFDGNLTRIPGGGRTAENGAEALTLGVNWYPNAQTRLMLNSTTYWYDHALGTPYSCPHTCTTNSLGNLQRSHETSWEILSRVQFSW